MIPLVHTPMNLYSMATVMDQAKVNEGARLLALILDIEEGELPDFEAVKKNKDMVN